MLLLKAYNKSESFRVVVGAYTQEAWLIYLVSFQYI
jgi:hypothetical protein